MKMKFAFALCLLLTTINILAQQKVIQLYDGPAPGFGILDLD